MDPTAAALLLLNASATLVMVGLIWFVQVVHYPLFARVDEAGFPAYEQAHTDRTARVVVPPMLIELLTAAALVASPPPVLGRAEAVVGLGLVGAIWASTALLQVPLHGRLLRRFTRLDHARLVTTNWLRTGLWSARGALVVLWIGRAIS